MVTSIKAAALRFLKIRPRSIEELKEKLLIKGFSPSEIKTAVHDLMASGFLEDRAFTKSWINYRLARPFGFKRIILELKAKGVDEELIQQAVAEIKGNYSEEDVALQLAQRRWLRSSGKDLVKYKSKIFNFLLRRGFTESVIIKVLKKL